MQALDELPGARAKASLLLNESIVLEGPDGKTYKDQPLAPKGSRYKFGLKNYAYQVSLFYF